MLSFTCKTAIKAVIYIASKRESGDKTGIKEVAEHINASEHTVGKILQTLARQGIINSVKGPSGGFFITQQQEKKPMIFIVQAIDGNQVFKECGLGLSKCSAAHPCPIHDEYKIARDKVEQLFQEKKIQDLCEPFTNGIAYLIG